MSKVQANGITINYEQLGAGEPLVLIPYLAADHACYAFQVADYAKHFTCISLDPRGAGETDKPDGRVNCRSRYVTFLASTSKHRSGALTPEARSPV
jgi:pimeloyl-ACP methyl ester carboxylesterase